VLVFSGSAAEVERRVEMAQRLGVPAAAVLRAPGSHTTRDEAAQLWELLGGTVRAENSPRDRRAAHDPGTRVFERAGFEPAAGGAGAPFTATVAARRGRADPRHRQVLARLYYRGADTSEADPDLRPSGPERRHMQEGFLLVLIA